MEDTETFPEEPDAGAPRARETAKEICDVSAAEAALNEAAKRVNAVWISFIVLCVYIFIATFTVTPAMLFREAPVKMPIFNAEQPLKVYFVMAPVLILAFHAYLIVLTKGLSESVAAYEDVLSRSVKDVSDREALRRRLDNSINLRALIAGHRSKPNRVDDACAFVSGVTLNGLPVLLLLLTLLIFLPYQESGITWIHRSIVFASVGMCVWALWPRTPWRFWVRRFVFFAFNALALVTLSLAAFPGEGLYEAFGDTSPHRVTVWALEGSFDPVDYVRHGSNRPFPNRLILPDDPKLAEAADTPAGGVSLSVRGRSFRKAVFDRSNLARIDFSAADLTGASLQGAKLEGAKFECARFASKIIRDDGPSGEYLAEYTPGGNLRCAVLNDVNLMYAALERTSFRSARLTGANLEYAIIGNADFSEATVSGVSFSGAQGSHPNFSEADLMGSVFHNARLRAANFARARLMGADLRNATLPVANFYQAGLQGATISDSVLWAADFSNAYMQGIDASRAQLQAASFARTFLHGATFVGANIKRCIFSRAALVGASLACIKAFQTKFESADLSGTFFVPNEKCKKGSYSDYPGFSPPARQENIFSRYSYTTDSLPRPGDYDDTINTYYDREYDFWDPWDSKKFDEKKFAATLDQLISGLPKDTESGVRQAFERLKPEASTKAKDEAERHFWDDWATCSGPLENENHEKALAGRLEAIACVAEGAPYVARGLLRAKRLDHLYENKEKSERERTRIFEHLKKASAGNDPSCLGAKGLVPADFP